MNAYSVQLSFLDPIAILRNGLNRLFELFTLCSVSEHHML